ncbi:MAG: hypothetical protein LBJ17_09065 [Dysgonamonadaceae bacterium]|jgi:hypothetical protein|nr:hypothetical protein [Dysgonamonadaceae bacterium]
MSILKRFLDDDKDLKLIYCIAAIASFIMFLFCPRVNFFDTATYYQASDLLLNRGQLDAFRTPLYPLFLAITVYPVLAYILQTLIFLFSVRFMYGTMKMLTSSRRAVILFSLIYVLHPTFLFYNCQLICESLSISLSAIYIYYTVIYLKKGKTSHCLLIHLTVLLLIFLKPIFIFLLVISFGIFIYNACCRKLTFRHLSAFIIAFAIQLSIIGGYMSAIHSRYGVFAISNVTDINLYWIMDEHGLIDDSTFPDDMIKNISGSLDRLKYINNNYGWKELKAIVNENMKLHWKDYLYGYKLTATRFLHFSWPFTNISGKNFLKFIAGSIGLSFYQLFVFIGFYLCLTLWSWIKHRKIPIISLVFFSYTFANCVILYLTAFNDFSRIIVPSLTVILVQFLQVSECIVSIIRRKPFLMN